MALFHYSFDSMSVLHDITTQAAAGTRSSNIFFNMEDANEHRSTMAGSDYGDDGHASLCSSGSLSTSTSLTSVSSSSCSEGIPTRPSSGQGWNFDGAWDVGEPNHTPKPQIPVPNDVHISDVYGDPTERGLTDSPFLIAQYVARQLRAGVEDFMPWSPDPQAPTQTPRISTPRFKGSPTRQYDDLLKALGPMSPYISAMRSPAIPPNLHFYPMVSPFLPSLPTVMITAPSTEQATPMLSCAGVTEAADFLTLQYSPRTRSSGRQDSTSFGWGAQGIDEGSDDDSQYEGDDEDMVLSHVKKALQASRRLKIGLKERVPGFFKMCR